MSVSSWQAKKRFGSQGAIGHFGTPQEPKTCEHGSSERDTWNNASDVCTKGRIVRGRWESGHGQWRGVWGQGNAFVGKTCLDTTHLVDNLENHGRQRHHMPGWETVMDGRWRCGDLGPGTRRRERGERGRCLCLSYCSPVSPGLSVSQCLRTQSAPIPSVSHLLRLLFLATTESYSATVKYIALLSPSFSERPPPPWQRERWKLTDFNLVGREGGR